MEKILLTLSSNSPKSTGTAQNFVQTLSKQYNLNNNQKFSIRLISGTIPNSVLQSSGFYITLDICSVGEVDGKSDFVIYTHGKTLPTYNQSTIIELESYDNDCRLLDKSFSSINMKVKNLDGSPFECDIEGVSNITIEFLQLT